MERESKDQIVSKYKYEVQNLSKYIPWLKEQCVENISSIYRGDGETQSFSFPVYDSTLLSFINDVGVSIFMDRNYRYVYTRNSIKTHEDEWRLIERTTIMDIDNLGGILSKYVLGGMTRSVLWKEGIQYQIFLRTLVKAKELIEYWDKPLEEME